MDDEELIRWSLVQRLSRGGFRVLAAEDGCGALARIEAETESVDLVILDLRLPDTDGITLLRRVRQLQPGCAGVLMTACASDETVCEAESAGAAHFVSKPFRIDAMLDIVRRVLDERG